MTTFTPNEALTPTPIPTHPHTPTPIPTTASADVRAQYRLQWLREGVTGAIAAVVVGGVGFLVTQAADSAGDDFSKLKDILLLVNTPLGMVLGFYFNKTSSDNQTVRAESAALQANVDKANSDVLKQQAQRAADELRGGLRNLRNAVKAQSTTKMIEDTESDITRAVLRADVLLGDV